MSEKATFLGRFWGISSSRGVKQAYNFTDYTPLRLFTLVFGCFWGRIIRKARINRKGRKIRKARHASPLLGLYGLYAAGCVLLIIIFFSKKIIIKELWRNAGARNEDAYKP